MSRDLLGEFGDFQSTSSSSPAAPAAARSTAAATSNNTFSTPGFPSFPTPAVPAYQNNNIGSGGGNVRPQSQNFDDLFGLFEAKPVVANAPATSSIGGGLSASMSMRYTPPSQPPSYQASNYNANSFSSQSLQPHAQAPHPPIQAASSEAIISGFAVFNSQSTSPQPASTTLFSTSPQQNALVNDEDDDFGDFAEEPLPSSNPSFGPMSNYSSSPPRKPAAPVVSASALLSQMASPAPPPPPAPPEVQADDDFGNFIFTPRVPTPPPQAAPFNLSSTLTNPNHSHPPHPPPHLYQILPLLTSTILSPTPFLNRLKPLSYPAKQRLLSSPQVKDFFKAVIYASHVTGRLIASKKIRPRRSYNSNNVKLTLQTSKPILLKDEREIAECVREYSESVGSLRAVVRGMGLVVPEISIDMPIVSAAAAVVAQQASRPGKGKKPAGLGSTPTKDEFCWLCGLGSLDRVPKLKEEGLGADGLDAMLEGAGREEWWVNGWGHRSCKNWWEGCGKKELKM